MKNGEDFLDFLPRELSIKILASLDDPIDLFRVGVVSRSWQNFVITNSLCKHMSMRMFPQLSRVDHVNDLTDIAKDYSGAGAGAGSSNFMEWEALKREHRVYAFFARECLLDTKAKSDCITEAVIASSTDNYPEESIDNTWVGEEGSYWSSKGQSNPAVPETLTYYLAAEVSIVTEIKIRPFEAYFQVDCPIYSAKFVKFRFGHFKSSLDDVNEPWQDSGKDKFAWTYTSQEFEMAQENRLQTFKLPEPVLCIGGVVQIELLGRVQRQETDGLFYICVSHVQVVGRSLFYFGFKILDPPEKFVLEVRRYTPLIIHVPAGSLSSLQARERDLEHIANSLQGNGGEHGWWEIDDEGSEEPFN